MRCPKRASGGSAGKRPTWHSQCISATHKSATSRRYARFELHQPTVEVRALMPNPAESDLKRRYRAEQRLLVPRYQRLDALRWCGERRIVDIFGRRKLIANCLESVL